MSVHVFFILGLVSWKILAVSSYTSYLNSVYNCNDRHKWLCFGGIMMKLGKRQRCYWMKRMHGDESIIKAGSVVRESMFNTTLT